MSKVENNYVQAWISDDLLYMVYKKGAIIGLDAAKEIVKLRMSLSAGKAYNVICYYNNIEVVSTEAKKYLAAKESCQEVKKVAFIVNSLFTKHVGNAFISFNKPPVPVKLFVNEKEGIDWLKNG